MWTQDFAVSDDTKLWISVWIEFLGYLCLVCLFWIILHSLWGGSFVLSQIGFFRPSPKNGFVLKWTSHKIWRTPLTFKLEHSGIPRRSLILICLTHVIDVILHTTRSRTALWKCLIHLLHHESVKSLVRWIILLSNLTKNWPQLRTVKISPMALGQLPKTLQANKKCFKPFSEGERGFSYCW